MPDDAKEGWKSLNLHESLEFLFQLERAGGKERAWKATQFSRRQGPKKYEVGRDSWVTG